jgi:hypothetical protein
LIILFSLYLVRSKISINISWNCIKLVQRNKNIYLSVSKDSFSGDDKNFLKSRSLVKKNYNEKVFFTRKNNNSDSDKENKNISMGDNITMDGECKKRIGKIIDDVMSTQNFDIGKAYIPSDSRISKKPKFKVNLNISNNYYNYNGERRTNESESNNDVLTKKVKKITNEDNSNIERPSRLTVFLSI